jgi:membrane protein DedA with SNARE-associated domain
MEIVFHWITQYGYAALFISMMLGIIGLPIPDETLLAFAGYLVFKNVLQLQYALLAAFLGSVSGISVSYEIGRRYGLTLLNTLHFHSLSEEKLARAEAWYRRFGKWALVVGYFIPGVRHFTAFAAGVSGLRYRTFGLFAYTGALVWSATFILLGKLVGEEWKTFSEGIRSKLLFGVGILGLVLIVVVVIRRMHLAKRA